MNIPSKRIALITGATSGIGSATAKILAKNGYKLIITGRRQERLNEIKHKLHAKYGAEIIELCFDIRDQQAVENAWKSLSPKWQKVDILINNAGLAKGFNPIF